MTTKTLTVTLDQFLAAFDGKGTRFATMLTVTRPKMLKNSRDDGTPNPYPLGVERLTWRNVTLGVNYGNAVNNQRQREGNAEEFNPEGLWPSKEFPNGAGERCGTYLVRHRGNGKRYFAIRPASDAETGNPLPSKFDQWRDVATGKILDVETLRGFLPKPSEQPATQETEKQIAWRTIETDNVLTIICGDTFNLTH